MEVTLNMHFNNNLTFANLVTSLYKDQIIAYLNKVKLSPMSREDFINYYKQNLNLSDNDFASLMDCLAKKLPQSFRIVESPLYSKVKEQVAKIPNIKKFDFLEDTYVFKKTKRNLKNHHKFIVNQTLLGTIQRQEIVSMIPVTLMGLEKNHFVLDLCAAPGSKTRQILSVVDKSGLVIANDQNKKRLFILISLTQKNPHESLIVTSHNASLFPILDLPNGRKFDRILCDVPCSSDGTIRKNPNVLTDWELKKATNLFDIQYNILSRAVQLVEKDGLIIYSTCSLNPLENECIVQNAILNEGLEVIDPFTFVKEDSKLKEFFKRKGLTTWKIEGFKHKRLLIEPTTKDIGLDKCIRIYPHDNDTGGFFVALLRKTSTKEKTSIAPKNVYKSMHVEVKTDNLPFLKDHFENIDNLNVVKRFYTNKSLYRISSAVKFVLLNNNLRVIYAGYKLFEKLEGEEGALCIRNVLYDPEVNVDVQCDIESLEKSLKNMKLDANSKKKSVIVRVKDLNVNLVCMAKAGVINLNVNETVRRGLMDFCKK